MSVTFASLTAEMIVTGFEEAPDTLFADTSNLKDVEATGISYLLENIDSNGCYALAGQENFRGGTTVLGSRYSVVKDEFVPYPTDGNVYYWDADTNNWSL